MTVVSRGSKGCGAARGHERRPQLVPAGAGAVNRSRALPKARVTARVRLREQHSGGDRTATHGNDHRNGGSGQETKNDGSKKENAENEMEAG